MTLSVQKGGPQSDAKTPGTANSNLVHGFVAPQGRHPGREAQASSFFSQNGNFEFNSIPAPIECN